MIDYAFRPEVTRFLKELRARIDSGDCSFCAGAARQENRQTLVDLELRIPDVWEILRRLRVEEYFKGPEPDDKGRAGELWFFFTYVKDKPIYVKINMEPQRVTCVSFKYARPAKVGPYAR